MKQTKELFHMNDADRVVEDKGYLLDVREPFEFEMGHVKGAKNISVNELENRLDEVPKDERVYVYCQKGRRGATAVNLLQQKGFDAVNLEEGFSEYEGKYSETYDPNVTPKRELSPETEALIKSNRRMVEASGMQCPGPLLKVNEVMSEMNPGEQMEIVVTDSGFCTDIEAWAKKTGHTVLKNEEANGKVTVVLEKNEPKSQNAGHHTVEIKDGATLVVFSGDLDKALASFIIASGAKSMGKDVTMFFTFWGLNIIKNPQAPPAKKKGLDKMFSMMMPKSAEKLPISKMNMFGMGSNMIKYVMNKKRVDALHTMIEKADKLGIKMIACTMSMDIMAIDESELLPNVDLGGVGTYLGDTEDSNLNLFI